MNGTMHEATNGNAANGSAMTSDKAVPLENTYAPSMTQQNHATNVDGPQSEYTPGHIAQPNGHGQAQGGEYGAGYAGVGAASKQGPAEGAPVSSMRAESPGSFVFKSAEQS